MKAAYCLYGQPRHLEEGVKNILNFVKQNSSVEFDFYYHTWFDEDDKLTKVIKDHRGHSYNYSKEIINSLTNSYNPVSYIYERQIMFKGTEYEHTLAYKNFDDKPKIFIRLSQWYSRCAVRNLLFHQVNYKNKHYDIVITSRFDIRKPLTIDLTNLDMSKLYVADFRLPSYIIPDNIMIMNQDRYLKLFISLNNFINSESVELRMEKYGLKYNLGMEELVCASFLFNFKTLTNVVYTPLIDNFV